MAWTDKQLERAKYARIISAIVEGRTPIIREYLPGVETLLREYNLEPNIDVFVPDELWSYRSPEEQRAMRKAFNARQRYKRDREALGLEYKSQLQRRKEKLSKQLHQQHKRKRKERF